MKRVFLSVPLAAAVIAACAGACDSTDSNDDGDATGGATTGDGDGDGDGGMGGAASGTGGAPATGGAAATGGDDGGDRTNIPCEAAGDDATCVNDTDCPAVEDGSLRAQAKGCLLNDCLASDDQEDCVSDCLVSTISTTSECSDCYGASAACSFENCFTECAADGDAPMCASCQSENGCLQAFFACSGLAVPE